MARLIDADALKVAVRKKFKDLPSRCEINGLVNAAPTVDAIPVEWMEDRIYDMKRDPLYRRYAEMLLMEWLQEWKEQEAQDG